MISIIVAISENNVIGSRNAIPWYLPRDLKHFKEVTTGHTVVMGRKTYQSIVNRLGKPLPDRKNIIITRQKDFEAPGCEIVNSLQEALEKASDENIFIIGGSEIYNIALPIVDHLHITKVHGKVDGDVFFTFDESNWKLISEEFHPKDEKNPFDCTFCVYERKT